MKITAVLPLAKDESITLNTDIIVPSLDVLVIVNEIHKSISKENS